MVSAPSAANMSWVVFEYGARMVASCIVRRRVQGLPETERVPQSLRPHPEAHDADLRQS